MPSHVSFLIWSFIDDVTVGGSLVKGTLDSVVFATSPCFYNSFKIKRLLINVPKNGGVDHYRFPAECWNSAGARRHVVSTLNEKAVRLGSCGPGL